MLEKPLGDSTDARAISVEDNSNYRGLLLCSHGERLQQDYGSKIGGWRIPAGRILEIFRTDDGIGIGSQVEEGIQG